MVNVFNFCVIEMFVLSLLRGVEGMFERWELDLGASGRGDVLSFGDGGEAGRFTSGAFRFASCRCLLLSL